MRNQPTRLCVEALEDRFALSTLTPAVATHPHAHPVVHHPAVVHTLPPLPILFQGFNAVDPGIAAQGFKGFNTVDLGIGLSGFFGSGADRGIALHGFLGGTTDPGIPGLTF